MSSPTSSIPTSTMDINIFDVAPILFPFVFGTFALSITATCCLYRRVRQNVQNLELRLEQAEQRIRSILMTITPPPAASPLPQAQFYPTIPVMPGLPPPQTVAVVYPNYYKQQGPETV
jgi:hypothetical protein